MEILNFDKFNMGRHMHDPDMGNWSYYYDANGNMTSQLDSMNQWIYFQYDAVNRLRQKDYGTQKTLGSGDIVYTYDETHTSYGKGRLTSIKDQSLSGSYTYNTRLYYDSMGQTTRTDKVVDGVNYTTQYGYDQLGRPNAVTYPDNTVVDYNYNGPLLNSVYEGSTTYAAYSGYDALGQPGTITYGNGVATSYIYDSDNNRLDSLYTTKSGNVYQNMAYGYDNAGNITSITDYTDNNQSHDADKIARLGDLNSMTYGYPASGTNSTRPHAATSAGSNTYAYDNNGNMTTGAGRSITYDPENRPMTVIANGNMTSFTYDGNGERVRKTAGGATTIYIGKLYECANGVCEKYIFANGQRIARKTAGSNQVFYYHTDHLGSSSVITDQNGNQMESLAYYPYGQTRTNTGSVNMRHKYTGQELDDSTGLYFYNARYYDPVLGRFISADSIVPNPADPQSLNRYSYVLNNPVNYIDPSGHACAYYYGPPCTEEELEARFHLNILIDDSHGGSGGNSVGGGESLLNFDMEAMWNTFSNWISNLFPSTGGGSDLIGLPDPFGSSDIDPFGTNYGIQPLGSGGWSGLLAPPGIPYRIGGSSSIRGGGGGGGSPGSTPNTFMDNWWNDVKTTNSFFFGDWGSLARTGIGTITSGSVAKRVGTVSLLDYHRTFPRGYATLGGIRGTTASLLVNMGINSMFSTMALETGIGVGAAANAFPVYGSNMTVKDWWVDYLLK